MVSAILEVCAESSLLIVFRAGWEDEEGFTEKVTFELAMEVQQHCFRDKRAGRQQQQDGDHLLSPCYVPGPVLRILLILIICSSL